MMMRGGCGEESPIARSVFAPEKQIPAHERAASEAVWAHYKAAASGD